MDEQVFKRKLNSIMRDNIAYRKVKGTLRGKLCHSRLYKAKLSSRVFEMKGIMSKRNYQICIMVDCSGSMDHNGTGNRSKYAGEATKKLVDGFKDVADIGVFGFNTKLYTFKNFDDVMNNKDTEIIKEKCIELAAQNAGGYHTKYPEHKFNKQIPGNHDAYIIRKVFENLIRRDGEKIFIVISDGQPQCDYSPNCGDPGCGTRAELSKQLKHTTKFIKSKKIPMIGIGVENDAAKDYYEHCYIIQDSKDIYEKMIEGLKKEIKRGG